MKNKYKIGLIDSGSNVAIEGAFISIKDEKLNLLELKDDLFGHGTILSNIIKESNVDIYCAQVFDKELITTAQTIALAIDYLVSKNVDLIHMSLGLNNDREILKQSVLRAIEKDILIVASAPSLSTQVTYPSFYKGVISVTGDARCTRDNISYINCSHAMFGACVMSNNEKVRGSSVAAAYFTKKLAKLHNDGIIDNISKIEYIKNNAFFKIAQAPLSKKPLYKEVL